jgi:aspartyl/asparaginyl beta-hydroxylase (cupin superfamily)
MEHLRRGDARGALALLEAALATSPGDPELHLHKALAHRALGSLREALVSLDATLAIDPYHFLAQISKGALLERMDKPRAAAAVYRIALRIAPRPESVPPALQAPLQRARDVVAEDTVALAAFLRDEVADVRARHAGEDFRRMEECLDVAAGLSRIYHSESVLLPVPRLPAIPFFERAYFPWFAELEAATDTIRGELLALLDAGMPGFAPYVAYAPGTPVNQFGELNHSQRWSSFWLWRDGLRQEEAIARCPQTAAILSRLPMADQPGFAPTALFSALAPRTRIPPHCGSTNARLLVHLPLLLPGPAGFRVGNETRQWRIGEAWAFDDTIEHEAWNDADALRVILIFDIWNPLLSAAERETVSELCSARARWYG